MTKAPGFADFFTAIADSTLPATDKAVCFAILRYRSAKDGTCFPSKETLGLAASLVPRTVGKSLKRLFGKGVVVPVRWSRGGAIQGRGIAHTIRLDYPKLQSLNRELCSQLDEASKSEPRDTQPRTSRPPTANETPPNGEPRSYKPSIHPTSEPTKEPSDGANQRPAARWMDGATREASTNGKTPASNKAPETTNGAPPRRESVYAALQLAGVRGANADHLANIPELTVETVRAETQRLRADPDVDNPPAALVRLLAKRHGVILRGRERPKRSGLADPNLLELSRQIASRRSQLRTLSSGESIGDIASRMLPPPLNP